MAYMNQERKRKLVELAKPILRKYGVKATFSVQHHSGIVCTLKSGDLDFYSDCGRQFNDPETTREAFYDARPDVNVHWVRDHWTGASKMFLQELLIALNTGNHDRSDIMTDYFDVGWYVYIHIGRWGKPPYEYSGNRKWASDTQLHPVTKEPAPEGFRWVHNIMSDVWVLERLGTSFATSVSSETYWSS